MSRPQLIATVSNAAYPLGGLLALLEGGPAAWPFFAATLALGAGSAYFHAVERERYETRRRGRLADRFGMLCVFGTLLLLSVNLTYPATYLAVWGIAAAVLTRIDGYSHAVVGILALISVLAVGIRGEPGWAALIAGLYGVAMWARSWEGPSSWTHGLLWHVVSAFSITATYASLIAL